MLHDRIGNICALSNATEKPVFYLTGKNNFRFKIAKTTPYKERPGLKPFHYYNIKAYLKGVYDAIEVDGYEADDAIAIHQTNALKEGYDTIICTRDKDIRAVPGWHFGWELGNQPQFGPEYVDEFGWIRLSNDRKSIKGTGLLFFYSQCLTGDAVDSIPGLAKYGPVKALKTLEGCLTPDDAFKAVYEAYKCLHGDNAEEYLLEQGRLLWMVRELDKDRLPVMWCMPFVPEKDSLTNKDSTM